MIKLVSFLVDQGLLIVLFVSVRSCENSSRNSSVVGGSGSGVSHKTHETWERAVRI